MSTTLIRNGTLIDGTGREPVRDAALLIRDGRIAAAGSAADISSPAGATVVDAAGGTILPGFIDAHVHLMLDGFYMMPALMTPFSLPFYQAIDRMKRTLAAGVTTVRDAGGADLGLKRAVETGLVSGPRMMIATSILSTTGGHFDFWLPSGNAIHVIPHHPGHPEAICDGVDGARKKVREVLRAGADIVKICATGGVMSPTDHPRYTQFSPDELNAIVQEAAFRNGTKVMAHAQGTEGIKQAVRAGVHSIEHGIYLDDEAIDLMVERGTYLVPTLLVVVEVLERGEADGMPEHGLQKTREVVDAHRESIRRAHQAGVKIALGTDAGAFPHGSNLRELGLMVDVGMSPMEAIVAGTRTAAECLGWDERLGTLEEGKLADVVIARGDPLEDISVLERPEHLQLVLKGGEVVAGEA